MALDRSMSGKRVRLIHCSDPWTKIKPGTEGTVTFIDDMGTLHVKWDDGSTLGMVAGDRWELVN